MRCVAEVFRPPRACPTASREKDRIYVLTPSSKKWHMGIHEARKSKYNA
jgi:hypothetical protein